MKSKFGNQEYDSVVWHPAMGRVADVIAYDTETTVVNDPSAVSDYVLGTAFNGARVFFICRQELGAFWNAHADCAVFMHTASFDLEVTAAACGFDFHPMIEGGRIRDISIYYRLLACAMTGDVPHKYSLGLMCCEMLGVDLDKDEAIRMDFGRFYNAGRVNYAAMPVPYLEYAAADAIATYRLSGRITTSRPASGLQSVLSGDLAPCAEVVQSSPRARAASAHFSPSTT